MVNMKNSMVHTNLNWINLYFFHNIPTLKKSNFTHASNTSALSKYYISRKFNEKIFFCKIKKFWKCATIQFRSIYIHFLRNSIAKVFCLLSCFLVHLQYEGGSKSPCNHLFSLHMGAFIQRWQCLHQLWTFVFHAM